MTDTPPEDVGQAAADFAALMNSAASAAAPADSDAPYGYTTDPKTGERRAKKTAGRPRKSPTVDELKAERAEAGPAAPPPLAPDQAPDDAKGSKWRLGSPGKAGADAKKDVKYPPMPREGYIADGVNRLYRRAGRMVKALDPAIGVAIIESTRPDLLDDGSPDPESVTVGKAWEGLCKTNPRIRKFVLACIRGGAWGELIEAHIPILMAVMMNAWVQDHLPFQQMIKMAMGWWMGDEQDWPGEAPPKGPVVEGEVIDRHDEPRPGRGNGQAPTMGGLTPDDLKQAMELASKLMGQASGSRRPSGTPRAQPRPAEAQQGGASPPGGP